MTLFPQDIIPDDINWQDKGCEIFPTCLNCPLPRCLEEEPRGRQKLKNGIRANQMAELKRKGKGVEEIACIFGLSKRTVQRALAFPQSSNRRTEE